MKLGTLAVCAVVSLVLAFTASAQSSDDGGLAHRRELAQRYFAAVHIDDTMHRAMASMVPAMMNQALNQNQNVPQATRDAVVEAAEGAATDLMPKIQGRMVDLMAERFTTAELQTILTFYESPTGQKIVEKTAEISSSMGPMIADLMPGIQKDMIQRLCAKIDCSTLPKPMQPKA